MDAHGLWDQLDTVAETVSLNSLAIDPTWRTQPTPADDSLAGLRLAIDASIWTLHIRSGRGGL
ncbi:hypothetical protein BC938DRAFT_484136 [Jimgerdemannia flammicorona]|uniref:Uncharacterized protein n=1 Tax=Jimgerdemannia flammicorona TaxID=994334 RepID=A0A433QAC6_9FUNG|nr:hypothetical protein BC938DRAFT_484136 [Jimgerdemannia flammicorona]